LGANLLGSLAQCDPPVRRHVRNEPEEQREAIRSVIEADGGNRVADLHVWRVGPSHPSAIVSIVTHDPREPDHYQALLSGRADMVHVTVEVHRCPRERAAQSQRRRPEELG